jgi:SpoVK/Ycf46/Vps4 family AAA+-type ATPase
VNKIDEKLDQLNDKIDCLENYEYSDDTSDDDSHDGESHDRGIKQDEQSNSGESNKIKKSKKTQKDSEKFNIDFVINDNDKKKKQDTVFVHPLAMILELMKSTGDINKQKTNEINSEEEEYDNTQPVYEFTYDTHKQIKTIDDLIELGENVKKDDNKYPIDMNILKKLVKPLKKLQKMVGIVKVKEEILDMIIYYLQNFENNNNNMLHTIIEGPPGTGKTRLGKILAEIYATMGIIPSKKFKLVRRTDLVGEYLGHTAIKTQNAIDEANGGVLFIDEAYALGNDDKKDQYSKECIDVLNQNLSENKEKLIVIIAGYPNQLDSCFFSYNEGLRRRFPFKYTIEAYNEEEIKNIFFDKLRAIDWKLCNDIPENELVAFFKENKEYFSNFGGDVENLLVNCKFAHSRRVLWENDDVKKRISKSDLLNAFENFKKVKKNSKDDLSKYGHLYM